MNSMLNWFVTYCINNQIISVHDEAWLRYGLEKRLSTLFVFIPFIVLAILLSSIVTASFYLGSFFYLRSQTNGYHAKTHLGCLIGSLLLEFFFLGFVESLLEPFYIILLLILSIIAVLTFAPYNHPMMDLNHEEYSACRKSSHIRVMKLSILCLVAAHCGLLEISKGISLGCAMASFLLVFPNIAERRIQDDSITRQGEQCSEDAAQSYD